MKCYEYYLDGFKGGIILFSQESDIVKTMRLIEGLKAELIINVGDLHKVLAENSGKKVREMLAIVVVNCYVLGKRLGINFAELDEAVKDKADLCGKSNNELETRFGDFSKLSRHLENKR